ncbi:MAG: peptide MFS transporter [Bacteroidota bacterium]
MFGKHPKGLIVLFFTEMWERFGFYTLMAIFVLYMDREFKWDDSFKGSIYGIFLLLCYLFPIVGGWLGDRVLGPKKTILIGATMMAVGYAAFAASSIERIPLFFLGVALVSIGTGIFKTNVSVMVGNLYSQNDPLKDAGFNIYYMGVNVGAMLAPLAATVISIVYNSYNFSFAAAGIGMVLSIVFFVIGQKNICEHSSVGAARESEISAKLQSEINENRQRVFTLAILFSIVIFFWVAFYQNGFALTLFAERSTVSYDFLRPETYQFFNPFFILLLTPLMVSWFARLREKGKEPSSPTKIFWGMFISGFSMIVMIFAASAGGDLDQRIMSPWWLISSYFVVTIAEILVSPMGLSFVSKVAPRRWQGLMMGFWFFATSLGSYGSGLLGKFYSILTHHDYYMILSAMLFLSSVLVLVFKKKLSRFAT